MLVTSLLRHTRHVPFLVAAALLLATTALVAERPAAVHANPSKIWVINDNVASATATSPVTPAAFYTAITTDDTTRAPYLSQLDAFANRSAGQVATDAAIPYAGSTFIVVQTDGSGTAMALNGRGLVCAPVQCDGVSTQAPNPVDHIAVWLITGVGARSPGNAFVVTAIQDAVAVDSPTLTVVGQAHDIALATAKTTVQEGLSTCAIADNVSNPARSAATAIFTDINGVQLAGYFATWASSAPSQLLVGAPITVSQALPGGTVTGAPNVICGVSTGSADLQVRNTVANAIVGIIGYVTRLKTIAVSGVPAAIALAASPAAVVCNGVEHSTVTATVTDAASNPVVDNTPVSFSVVALGTANPIQTATAGGQATSIITPLSIATSGVTVIVAAGTVQMQIGITCIPNNPDFFAAAMDITTMPQTIGISTLGAGLEQFELQPCGSIGGTVWLRYAAPPSPPGAPTLSFDTVGSYFNTAIAVYRLTSAGPPAALTLVGCSASGTTSGVTFASQPGSTYYVQAGGKDGATGYLVVNASPDSDGDTLTDIQEIRIGSDPANPDTDADGCGDGKEVGYGLSPTNPWDFYSVPVPALFAASNPLTDFRDKLVAAADAQAVFAYFKKGAKTGTTEYEQDLNANGIKDGVEYDRTVAGAGKSGPPDGIVAASDAQLAFAQFKLGYHC